jgi:hypothetical protein
MSASTSLSERERRWRLALGADDNNSALNERDRRMDTALTAIYGSGDGGKGKKGGLGDSSPRVARWLGDIREFFPAPAMPTSTGRAPSMQTFATTRRSTRPLCRKS